MNDSNNITYFIRSKTFTYTNEPQNYPLNEYSRFKDIESTQLSYDKYITSWFSSHDTKGMILYRNCNKYTSNIRTLQSDINNYKTFFVNNYGSIHNDIFDIFNYYVKVYQDNDILHDKPIEIITIIEKPTKLKNNQNGYEFTLHSLTIKLKYKLGFCNWLCRKKLKCKHRMLYGTYK